jgi:succinate-semialdehyde dehydrogenase/glutarate-semialdehyde dehydrogenase
MSKTFQTINPATGEVLRNFSFFSSSQIESQLAAAAESHRKFQSKSVSEKSSQLKALAAGLRSASPDISAMISLEMGKAIRDSEAEIEKCAKACEYFGENLEKFLAPQPVSSGYSKSLIVKDSLGPILAHCYQQRRHKHRCRQALELSFSNCDRRLRQFHALL